MSLFLLQTVQKFAEAVGDALRLILPMVFQSILKQALYINFLALIEDP